MSEDLFSKRAQNVVNAVVQMGATSTPQVAEILKSVHQDAIEMVAQDFTKRASMAMKEGKPDMYHFCLAQVQRVRQLKNGNPNL
jgi:hypothetical protein